MGDGGAGEGRDELSDLAIELDAYVRFRPYNGKLL
jgi:hypothetical protein